MVCFRYEIERCEVIWAIKDPSITHAFVDAGAAEFFMPKVNQDKPRSPPAAIKRTKYKISGQFITSY